jgi:exopolysaccharide production protein ExoF
LLTAKRSEVERTMRSNGLPWEHSRGYLQRISAYRGLKGRALAALLALIFVSNGAGAQDYILGAQDKLKIRVFEWRPVTGTAFEWTPLNGEFVISASGTISLPIIGSVKADGLTVDQVSASIGERLKDEVGMQKRPNASVEVSEYRPFFITGLVSKPGRYNYSPDLSVVQALSMAGGTLGLDPDLTGLQRDALVDEGDLRALEVERLGLLARQARVDAVIENKPGPAFSSELTQQANRPVVDRMMREEEDLFETREHSIAAEIDSLNQAKMLASNQIEALKTKAASLAKQIDLANKEMANVTKLLSAGLTVSSRSLGASQNLSDLESRSLDVALANLKAQQDVAKADQDIANSRNRYRVDALTEATDVRDRLSANAVKTATAHALLENISERSPIAAGTALEDGPLSLEITIDRAVGGRMQTLVVGDNDQIIPGDILRVEKNPQSTGSAKDGSISATVSP